MDKTAFQERVTRLREINEIITTLDPSIRPGALALLADYVTGQTDIQERPTPGAPTASVRGQSDDPTGGLLAKFPDGKPSDNALLIAASLYSQYGAQPFTLEDVRAMAESAGATIPATLNMTFNSAQRDGKLLFQHTGRSEYKPTVHGELFFQKTYQVAKGTKRRALEASE